MIITLIPIAVWTLGALIIMWPADVQTHVRENISTYSVEGLTVQTGRITQLAEINCDGIPGSTQAPGEEQVCARASAELLDGPEAGREHTKATFGGRWSARSRSRPVTGRAGTLHEAILLSRWSAEGRTRGLN